MGQTRVHRILNEVGALAFPGVFDTLSAQIASRAGFPLAFVAGYSVEAARAAGADASFVEAPASRQDLEAIGRRSPAPNVANMIEGGRTPVLPQQELAALGFQLILYPLAGLFAAARAIEAVYRTLRESGTTLEEAGRL